ncbi:hypothetical protein DEDE109153_14865 [Deinococcus deserti]
MVKAIGSCQGHGREEKASQMRAGAVIRWNRKAQELAYSLSLGQLQLSTQWPAAVQSSLSSSFLPRL